MHVIVPPYLLEMQSWFGECISRPRVIPRADSKITEGIDKWISPGPQLSAEERLNIYHEQYWLRLLTILQKDYPTLLRLFSPNDFNRLIGESFLLQHPPDHWSLHFLGWLLPQWIKQTYREEDQLLVSQVALVDLAHEKVLLANAGPPLKDFSKQVFLQPFVVLLELEADLFQFREEMLQEEPAYWTEHPFPKIKWGLKRPFALYLHQNRILYEEISQTQYQILTAFEKGATLEDAMDFADESCNIADWFRTWAERNWLRSL